MLSAGTKDQVALKLFVLSEGRMQPDNFPVETLDPAKLVFNFDGNTSNFADVRAEALAKNEGATWLVAHADHRGLFSGDLPRSYATSDGVHSVESVAQLYF